MTMRVLFTTRWYPSFDAPGRAIFVADQATALMRSGVTVEVASWEAASLYGIYRSAGDAAAEQGAAGAAWCDAIRTRSSSVAPRSWGAPGVGTVRLPVATSRVTGVRADAGVAAASAAQALLAWVDHPHFRSPTIVHAHVGLPDGVAAIALAERLGVPLVTTEHESSATERLALPGMREAYLPLLQEGRALLAVSQSLRNRLATALEVDPARIGVVPNVVDVDAFAGGLDTVAREAGELLWVGGLKAGKGIDVLLAAFARLQASRPDLRLRLIGRAPSETEEARCRALARDLGIAGAVAFEGQASRSEVAAAMARATVFVHPSPMETFGVVAAEALAAGLPVAATPSGGVEEVVGHDGRFGVIADDLGAEALAVAVARVLDDPTRFDAREMRASVTDRYGPSVVAGQLRDRYAELLERRAGRAVPAPAQATHPVGAEVVDGEAAVGAEPLTVVVSMQRSLATARLAPVPEGLARGLLAVTATTRGADGPRLPGGPHWIELDPDRAYKAARAAIVGHRGSRRLSHRIARILRNPLRPMRLRRLNAERPMLRATSLRTDLAAFLTGLGPPAGIEIVALAADDVDLVLPLLDDRVRLSPGTLRGLVDRWDAAGRPVVPSPEVPAVAVGYDPTTYWERLHHRGDLSTVGQSGMSPELNAWLYRALEANLRRFVHRHSIDHPLPPTAFDVGTGIGYWVRVWRSMGISRVDGCDLVPAAVAAATDAAGEVGAEGQYVVADLAIPGVLGGRAYGLVSCFNVLLHLVDDDAFATALTNVAGLVEDGGYLVLAEPILLDPSFERPRDRSRASRARPFAAYRDGLVAAGLELVALEPATVLANNPIEARSMRMLGYYERWWRFVKRRDRARSRWIGPLVAGLDRLAIRTGQAPTTKFALFRRPPARG